MPTTTTAPVPDIPLPAGAEFGDEWDPDDLHRVIMGAERHVTDSDVVVWTSAIQFADGSIDDAACGGESPQVNLGGNHGELNSDQARELAAAILEAANEIDGWTAR
jgi:hypothetical protein